MKILVRVLLVMALVSFVGACAQTRAEGEARLPSNTQENRVPGEYLVGLAAGSDPTEARKLFAAYGVAEWRHVRKDTYLVRLQNDPGPDALARLAEGTAAVRYVEPNRIYTTQ